MAQQNVDELVVQLEGVIKLTSMERGIKMNGTVLVDQPLNKWGVILRSAWKDLGEIQVNWVKDNTYIIIVKDEELASRILSQVP